MAAKRCFLLTRSRLAFVFQLSVFVLILLFLSFILSTLLWLLSVIFGMMAYFIFIKRLQAIRFEHLDADVWSLQLADGSVQQVVIHSMVDHQLYIVVYFQQKQLQPMLIWRDQLTLQQWKLLKMLVKLH